MLHATGMIAVSLALLGAGPAARWLGQDGHDLVGPSSAVKPSDVQDLHILLGNLPPQNIRSVRIVGEGGDEWTFPSRGSWAAALERKPGAPTADLFLEPTRVEKGRALYIAIEFDGGAKAQLAVRTQKADPNRRMPGAELAAKWVGQDREDWAGPDLGVGPDGLQDAHVALAKLSPRLKVVSAELEAPGGQRWHAGVNPQGVPNAELVRNDKDPTRADFYFQPDRDLRGKTLRLTVQYENGKPDSVTLAGGKVDPRLKMPPLAVPELKPVAIKAEWLGQDGSVESGPGTTHVVLTGVPARGVAAVVMSDGVRGVWRYRESDRVPVEAELENRPLLVRRGDGGRRLDLFFTPYRDEAGATMTARLVFNDGSMAVAEFPGGRSDIARCAPTPATTAVTAKPGDDIQALVERYGTVRLSKGNYPLSRPLTLGRPVTLAGDPGAVLQFTQGPGEPHWATALKVLHGGTTLQNFAVRFTGPVRWKPDARWGAAIIGVSDRQDGLPAKTLEYVVIRGLDIEAPPAANPKGWEHAPHCLRLVSTAGGEIVQNTLRGGAIQLFSGPWKIESNDYRGTPVGTVCDEFAAVHNTNDVVVRGNRAQPVGPSGKTWRFLVMTGQGTHDRVESNEIVGVGARDDDTVPWANEPEIILTESYTLLFEGRPAAVSADRRVVRIARYHNRPPRTGDAVAVLTGESAGQWRRIAQAINGTTFLLDRPLPENAGLLSIATGFVGERFENNRVDAPGGTRASAMVLAGNHFGTRVRGNRFAGAGDACQVTAYPTESPFFFGWSHVAFCGGEVAGNVFEDSARGAVFGVSHGKPVKTNRGRVYMSLTLRDNTVRWTDAFLTRRQRDGVKPAPGITIGTADSLDPGELRVEAAGNHLDAPPSAPASGPLVVRSAEYNGQRTTDKRFALPREPAPATAGRPER